MIKSFMSWTVALALAACWAGAATARDFPAASGLPLTKYLQLAVRPSSPRVDEFVGDNRAHAAYELYVTNFTDKPIRIVAVKIAAAAGGPIFSKLIERDELARDFVKIGAKREPRQTPVLGGGESAVIFLFPDFGPPDKTPTALVNSLDIEFEGKPDTEQRLTIAPIQVIRDGAVVIQRPFAGANWLAANGPSNTSTHRRAILTVDGYPRIGQRFAIDFVRIGPDGRTYHGDPNRNASYYAYDTPIMAVAAGTIAATHDGVPENTPQSPKMAVELNLSNVGGNFIAEKIGAGRYVMYAHLMPGSLKVKPGDKVAAGQIIARLGNTGNSSEPHLHLQVCDAPSFAASSGIPYEFDSFKLERYRIDRKDGQPINLALEGSTVVKRQTPMEDELVTFSGP